MFFIVRQLFIGFQYLRTLNGRGDFNFATCQVVVTSSSSAYAFTLNWVPNTLTESWDVSTINGFAASFRTEK